MKAEEATINGNSPFQPMIDRLDAYGHLTYTVGFSPESEDAPEDRDGDWLACGDFLVETHPETGEAVVAVHVVVNSDSGGFIDTVRVDAFCVDNADDPRIPYDLLDYWRDISKGGHGETWSASEDADADAASARWRQDLRAAIVAALGYGCLAPA